MLKKMFLAGILAVLTTSINAQYNYEKGDPSKPEYDYLNAYGNLKDYIDYSKYPNFKLGIGTIVSDYNQKDNVYRMTNANFTETVPGNAMKMASCVSRDGTMEFSAVKTYVSNATAAGLDIYGHTLAWHSQQPVAWLSSLIKDLPAEPLEDADTVVYEPLVEKNFTTNQSIGWHSDYTEYNYNITFDGIDGMKVHTDKTALHNYMVQYIAMDNIPTEEGNTVEMVMTVKGSAAGEFFVQLGDWGGGPASTLNFSTEWQDVRVTFENTLANSFLLIQSGRFLGDIYIKNIKLLKAVDGKKLSEDRRCIMIDVPAKVEEAWDNQFWILTDNFVAGDKYEFSADVRADVKAYASTQVHTQPGAYVHYIGIGNVPFTPQWKTVTSSGIFEATGSSIAFNLSEYAGANRYYLDNVSLKINGKEMVVNGSLEETTIESFKQKLSRGAIIEVTIVDNVDYVYVPSSIPLSAEVVHDTLVYAMDKWIKGMMEACDGKVKAWDVVNEAISGGGNDGEGNYTLQHRDGFTAGANTWDVGGDGFFWQDYMGDLEYVRQAVRLARKYGPEDIKLFINDYNLESDWDQNKKLKSLINWIKKWEADGETFIDGIGTQMHISYYENSEIQTSKENAIVNMFQLMAATGKLVRVSEFDMGYVDKDGNDVTTDNMTEERHKNMADFYKWIIQQYLTIVPPAQQWGICLWCPTDSPSDSGWRANAPVGIWDLCYYRKHVYAGVCEGLGGVKITSIDAVESDTLAGDREDVVYDIQGRRVKNLMRGLYIINNKKVAIK